MSQHHGIFSPWLGSGVGRVGRSLQEGRVVGSLQRGYVESHGITYASPGLGVLAEVTSCVPLPSTACYVPAKWPLHWLKVFTGAALSQWDLNFFWVCCCLHFIFAHLIKNMYHFF